MSKQKKRNIRLLSIFTLLFVLVMAYPFVFSNQNDNLGIDRSKYAFQETLTINKVISKGPDSESKLSFQEGKWYINDQYLANPLNVRLLFATLQKINVRRKVGTTLYDSLSKRFEQNGRLVSFYADETLTKELEIYGDFRSSSTFIRDNEEIFLVEIPGYRAFIYGLLAVSDPEWRNPNVFHEMNWRNLKSIDVNYPGNEEDGFSIIPYNRFYKVDGTQETDTTRMTNYIDYISLLEVDRYTDVQKLDVYDSLMKITITDIGNNRLSATFFSTGLEADSIAGTVEGRTYFLLSNQKFIELVKNHKYFEK